MSVGRGDTAPVGETSRSFPSERDGHGRSQPEVIGGWGDGSIPLVVMDGPPPVAAP
jgi:hypothetical protein